MSFLDDIKSNINQHENDKKIKENELLNSIPAQVDRAAEVLANKLLKDAKANAAAGKYTRKQSLITFKYKYTLNVKSTIVLTTFPYTKDPYIKIGSQGDPEDISVNKPNLAYKIFVKVKDIISKEGFICDIYSPGKGTGEFYDYHNWVLKGTLHWSD